MPDQSSNLTTLRAGGFASVYMSVYRGVEVAAYTVGLTVVDQANMLAVTLDSGSSSDVKPGYRVDIYSSTGDFKGRTRIRYAGTIGDNAIPVREHSQGVAQIVAGDVVRVYNDVRLSDKLVTADATFAPDGMAPSDHGSNPPPLACSGGAWAGFASMLPIPFTGSASDYVDPDSNGPLSHAWTFPTGLTADDDDVADVNIIAADAGEYLVTHVVTDDDNSKSTTQYVPVIVHDANNPPYEVVVEDVSGDEENGHSFSVRVFGDADLTSIPDGAFCILWMEQYLAGSVQAFGAKSSGRSHILGVGYIRREEGSFDSDDGTEGLRFEVISPLARLNELVGYSKVMTSEATPDEWSEIKTLGTERAIRQLWQFYTNASEAGFDFVTDSNYVNYTYPQIFLQRSTPLGQMRELADATDARITCDRTGRFSLHTRPELLAVTSRAAATKTITLTTSDIINWRYTREHWRTTEMLEARGFTGGGSPQPIFSRWPGLAPGLGNQNLTVERLIALNQGDLNARAGRRGAAADGIYTDANGVQQMALDLELTLPTGYHVADFYDEYIAIDLTTELRELDLSDQLFVLRSVRLEVGDDGTLQCVWTLRTATSGVYGVTYHPPQESDNGLPPWTPPTVGWDFPTLPVVEPIPWTWDEFPPEAEPIKLFVTLYGAASVGEGLVYRAKSWNPTTGDVDYEDIGGAARGITGQCIWATSDPYNYAARYVITTDGLFYCSNIWAGSVIWTQVATNLEMFGNATWVGCVIRGSINRRGYLYTSSGNIFAYSTDAGATWNQTAIDGGTLAGNTSYLGSAHVFASPHNNGAEGHIYAGYGSGRVYKSTNWGASFAIAISNFGGGFTGWPILNVPYMKPDGSLNLNGSSQMVYAAAYGGDYQSRFVRSDNGMTSIAYSETAGPFAGRFGSIVSQNGIHTNTFNGHIVDYYRSVHQTGSTVGIFRSINGTISGASKWRHSMGDTNSSANIPHNMNGWPTDPSIMLFFSTNNVLEFYRGLPTPTQAAAVTAVSLLGGFTGLTSYRNVSYAEFDLSDYIPAQP